MNSHKVKSILPQSRVLYAIIFLSLVISTVVLQILATSNISDVASPVTTHTQGYVSNTSNTNLYAYSGLENCGTRSGVGACSPLGRDGVNPDSLPAWRWTNMELDADTSGFLGFFQQIPVSVSTVFLMLSQFFWSLLLGLTKIALEPTTLLTPAAPAINTVLSQIGERIIIFAILFWSVVFFKIIKNVSKGRAKEAITSFVIFSVLFAGVTVMLDASQKATAVADEDQIYVKNTLPWFANVVSGVSLRMAGDIALAGDTFKSNFVTADDQGATPTCTAYNNAIYKVYSEGTGNKALPTLSKLWEQTQYNAWAAALFGTKVGSVDLGGRVMCHWAESVNRTPAVQQQKIASLAYGPAFGEYADSQSSNVSTGDAEPDPSVTTETDSTTSSSAEGVVLSEGQSFAIFGPHSTDDRRRAMTAWAACQLNSSSKWETAPYFKGVWGEALDNDVLAQDPHTCSYPFSTASDGLSRTTGCSFWACNGDDFLIFGDRVEDAFDGLTGSDREKLVAFESFSSSFSGANIADRFIQSLLALLVAGFFLYALGFLSLGMIAAQLMLIILLMLFPLTVALLAIGSSKAKPMLKLTGTTAVAQAIFALILVTILILASLFQELLAELAPQGFLRSLMVGLAPIAAFFVVHKILKTIGMASILSPTGAMSFLGSAALLATGDSKLGQYGKVGADGRNSIQRGGSKGTASGIAAGAAAGATALALGKKGAKGASSAKKLTTKEGREELKKNRQARKEGKVEEARRRIANRLNKDKLGRFDKIANWADSKQMSDNVFARTVGSTTRGAGLLAAGAGGMAGLVAAKAYSNASPEVRGALDKAKTKIGRHLGSDWRDQTVEFDPETGLNVPVNDKEFIDSELAADMKNIEDSMLELAIADDPNATETLQIDSAGKILQAAGAAVVGEYAAEIESTHDLAAIKHSASIKRGVNYNNLVVASTGAVVPKAWMFDKDKIRNLSFEESRDPMYWLPMEDKIQLEGETPDQYAARMISICYERGVMTSKGEFVDAYSVAGFDTNKESDRKEIEAWLAGGENKVLDSFVITSKDSAKEQRRIAASRKSIERANLTRERIVFESQVQAYGDLMDAPEIMPVQLELVQLTQKSVTDKLVNQREIAVNLAGVQEKIQSKQIELSSATGQVKEQVELDIFNLRQAYEKLEDERKQQGNDLDRAFAELKDKLFEHANTVIRTKTDVGVASGSITNEDALYEEMIKGFESFQSMWDAIEENTNKAWLGNVKSIDKLLEDLNAVSDITGEETLKIVEQAKDLLEKASEETVQLEAVRKVRTGSKIPTARELAESYSGSSTNVPLL